jgi:hypothetical protein
MRARGAKVGGGREYSFNPIARAPTEPHKTPQFSQVLRSPANPIDIRLRIYLHKGVDICLKGRIIDVIGSAGANLLKCRLSTKHYNHVADLGYRNRPREDIPTE